MNLFSHKYPQNTWAEEIIALFKKGIIMPDDSAIVYDAPCGNGIIGNLVFKGLPKHKMLLLDNDVRLQSSPYVQLTNANFSFLNGDIFAFKPDGKDNVWLLINSLYCLPDAEKLLESKRETFKYIIAIFPDIKAGNFKYFAKHNPDFINPSLMDSVSTDNLFESCGYKKIYSKSITRLAFHKWNKVLDRLRFPLVLKNMLLTVLDKLLFFLPGHYTIIAFIRYE